MGKYSSVEDFVAYTDRDETEMYYRKKKSPSSKSEKGGNYDALTEQVILTKNADGSGVFNMDDIREKLGHLRSNSNAKIKNLTGKLKQDFDSLAQYVAWIYNTESYHLLYDEIKSYFCETEQYIPGTIGAYCGGCLVKEKGKLPSHGCSVICAGSIPPPYQEEGWEFCNYLVIWAVWDGTHFNFTTLNEVEDENKAIIFIDYPNLEEFPGFSSEEKKTLADNGIQEVRLVYYVPHGNPKYVEVTNGFVPLDQVKTRNPQPAPTPAPVATGSNFWGYLFLAIVILAIIFLFLFCGNRF